MEYNPIFKGITKTIIDGLKDAQMQYDYAVIAKKHDPAIAKLHLDEASKRLSGITDWRKRLDEMMGKRSEDGMEAVMWEHYDDWKEKLHRCIAEFKM